MLDVIEGAKRVVAREGSDFVMALSDAHSIATGKGDDYISINPMGRPPGLQLFVPNEYEFQ